MIRGKIEDEKKLKDDNIKTQMKQQWLRKPLENSSESSEVIDTQENGLGDSIIYA